MQVVLILTWVKDKSGVEIGAKRSSLLLTSGGY